MGRESPVFDREGIRMDTAFVRGYIDQIAVNVRRLRGTMTQEDFAKKCGVSRTTIIRIEGRKNFEIRSLLRIAEAFHLYPFNLCQTEEEAARARAEVDEFREELKRDVIKDVLRTLKKP
jgi:DNA-binding XRE family transcriptional regulator